MKQISRRNVMAGGVVSLAALGVAGAVSASSTADPLVELERKQNELKAEAVRLEGKVSELSKQVQYPKEPTYSWLNHRGKKVGITPVYELEGARKRTLRECNSADSELKAAIDAFYDRLQVGLKAEQDIRKAEEDRLGITAVDEQAEECWKDCWRIEDQIRDTPATTTEGIVVKLRFIARDVSANPDIRDSHEQMILSASQDAERLAL